MPHTRLLDPQSTAAVILGASDWTEAGLGRAPSFLRSAGGILAHLLDSAGLGLDPTLVINLFDDVTSAGEQLARIRDTLDVRLRERRSEERPVADLLVYYVGHGYTDAQGHLALLVRRSREGMEAETGIRAPDLAQVLRRAAPQQRRLVILDCCFSEAAVRDFVGMSGALDQVVAAVAAKDVGEALPQRGGLLLCSSPKGQISIGAPNAERTLFTGAILRVLREGVSGSAPALSFADLRDAAYDRMVEAYGANAPRPALHPVNQSQGDLTSIPAFPNRASVTNIEVQQIDKSEPGILPIRHRTQLPSAEPASAEAPTSIWPTKSPDIKNSPHFVSNDESIIKNKNNQRVRNLKQNALYMTLSILLSSMIILFSFYLIITNRSPNYNTPAEILGFIGFLLTVPGIYFFSAAAENKFSKIKSGFLFSCFIFFVNFVSFLFYAATESVMGISAAVVFMAFIQVILYLFLGFTVLGGIMRKYQQL